MKLYYSNDCYKKVKKEKRELQKELIRAATSLSKRISDYLINGISFVAICNDERVKYDKHGNFYTYKHHGKNRSQLRVLYTCIQKDNSFELIITDYYEKRSGGSKEHIKKFDAFNKLSVEQFYDLNKLNIMTA